MGTDIIVSNRADDNVIELSMSIIYSKIYEIRGCRVMLDYDLAELYQVETRILNQSVKRNIKRFPNDFMFQLTNQEWEVSRSQIATLKKGKMNMSSQIVMTSRTKRPKSAPPYAFTEQGIAMLSGLLNSDIAIETNIDIMRTFVMLRKYALSYAKLNHELEEFMKTANMQFNDIYKILDAFLSEKEEDKPRNPIGFKQKN